MIAPDGHPAGTLHGHLLSIRGDRCGKHLTPTNNALGQLSYLAQTRPSLSLTLWRGEPLAPPKSNPRHLSHFITAHVARVAVSPHLGAVSPYLNIVGFMPHRVVIPAHRHRLTLQRLTCQRLGCLHPTASKRKTKQSRRTTHRDSQQPHSSPS
jgi:hypothetical protein